MFYYPQNGFQNNGFSNQYVQQPVQQQPVHQPVQQQPIQQPIQQPVQQPIQQSVQQPIQNGGFVIVQDESEIVRYPVAHGNLVTFRIENQPVIVEKSLGYSQFDTPHYERYRLSKEDMAIPEEKKDEYLLKSDYENAQRSILDNQNEIFSQIEDLKRQISEFKKPVTKKKEVET